MVRRVTVITSFALAGLIGCGSDDGSGDATEAADARTVALEATEYAFSASEAITIASGDTITFEVENVGEIDHELEVLDATNRSLGKTERIAPGATRSVTVTFDDAGLYRVICDIDDHLSRGQQAQFEVIE